MERWLVLIGFVILRTGANLDLLDVEVEYQCIQHCPLQNRTDEGHYDYACDYECNINQCAKGCKLWRKALKSSCQIICSGLNERLTPKELYCVMGCNDAMTKYFSQLKSKLLIPPAPALVADSLNATSLKLEWNFPEAKKAGLGYHIQWRYEELTVAWHYCRNATWNEEGNVAFIENLQPYTKYRFRVALILGHQENSIVSAPSVVISTLPSGLPTSPPSIVRAAPIDCTRISVSWEPGPFPHGPLLSYVLQITDNHPEVHSEVKDIPPENNFYMFRNLKPSHNYTLSIRMRNGVGSGPSARVFVSTPSEPLVRDTQQPVLILGTEHGVIEQGTDILDEPVIIYSTLSTIRGIAIHISKRLLFVSDSAGQVMKMALTRHHHQQNITSILQPNMINFMPLDLSVDWLNDQLYILGEVKVQQQRMWQVTRCNLDGGGLTVAIAGLTTRPSSIEVDPYNGYFFWVIPGYTKTLATGGLYRLDVSDISNGIKHEVMPELILQDPNLGAFTVDHSNFRLLVSSQKQNTINAVSLDGNEVTNLRPNIIKSKLQRVVSLATANKKFYWTDGDDVFYEEYHNSDDSYFHNSYPDLSARSYKKVIINLASSQPTPIPVNPPTSVQAIFGKNIAKTIWQSPHLLGIQGKGAWQNWSYEISVKEVESQKEFVHDGINSSSYVITHLKENTEYILKAAAYTSFGKGPWSSEFRGTTLDGSEDPYILWSAEKGLLKTDAAGENVQVLIHRSEMKNYHFTDMAWYSNQIYLVTNNSLVYWYNLDNQNQGRLIDIDSVGCIAVDWIGQKLYWSNLKRQMFIRGNLNGTQQEPLPIFTVAKELTIDPVQAYLYWSTGYAVECAHLNGADRMEYHPVQLFTGKQVMGLTLDVNEKFVYWIVRGTDGWNLFRAPMAGYFEKPFVVETISNLQKSNMQGPLCYFHRRLLWIQDEKSAAISDLEGRNIATISGKSMSGLTLVYVVDSSLHKFQGESKQIVVIPDMIDRDSVRVVGSANSFNITWKPVGNVNYGTVFYEVNIDNMSGNASTVVSKYPTIKYWQKVTPFTKLQVAIRAFTYWGSSPQIRAKVYSPASTPSVPTNLRSYVTYQLNITTQENLVSLTFRWDPPMFPNGVIEGYKLYCWCEIGIAALVERIDLCEGVIKSPEELEMVLNGVAEDEIYYFNIQAFTEIGDGDLSDIISVNASEEAPLPTLLIASEDSIFIQDIDVNQNHSLLHGINTPVEIGYLIKENTLFWINQMQDLMMYNLMSNNKTKIVDLHTGAKSLTIDWLERSIYYVHPVDSRSTIFKVNLNHLDRGQVNAAQEVLSISSNISKIEVSPFTKKLYWVENCRLMTSNADGTEIKSFFSEHSHNKRALDSDDPTKISCNCPSNVDIGNSFTLDHSRSTNKPVLIFVDSTTQNVISSDKDGCFCDVIANNTVVNHTLPLDKIKSDFGSIYWTNPNGLLYALKRDEANIKMKRVNVKDVLIFGWHMQPFPPKECLSPKQHNNLTAVLKFKTSNSLTIQLPEYEVDTKCSNISIATVEYRIFYTQLTDGSSSCDGERCMQASTFEREFTMRDLKPFTRYVVAIAISNYYTETEEVIIGPSVVFQTAAGAPSKPQKVSAVVLNPTMAKVTWSPPEELNGATVHYEIYWKTEGTVSGVRQKEQPVVEQQYSPNSTEYLTTILTKLSPNETYTIWVRAYSESNETSSDSEKVQIVTYPEPSGLVLVNKTAYTLKLSWNVSPHVEKYIVQCSSLVSNQWDDIVVSGRKNGGVIIFKDNLRPKTQYKFRVVLFYKGYHGEYIWPTESKFIYETLGDRPSPPGVPIIQYVKPNIYKVWWEASRENGAVVELYTLEGLELPNYRTKRSTNRTAFFYTAPSIDEEERQWKQFYNGTETSWIIDGLSDKFKYAFRVTAKNAYGWSDPSEESTEFDLNEAARMAEKQNPISLVAIGTFVPAGILLVIITFFMCRKCDKPKKAQVVAITRGPDVELATLRELPRRGIHNTNVLYVATQPTNEEITLLPHISRDKITLMKFLGSGAFGEVFEGKAKGIFSNNAETKVAVKTLRKGASDQEKTEFLQEAQLMSNFKHEHILQLLGVCLDNDPHFILMELMQGGDLLTYLRSSRNPSLDTPPLLLMDLLKMCVDVAKGCRYLEEMHFVHRDLACRNCLVSSKHDNRIVKIGDFGLARDIYKNDYYRKEGEGLLPVRWMAPESLVDGVFTSQSDVWAFGVLLWEIMTLGQQPYPARNNLEVLHYVRGGGRLGKPEDCPETLHNLMLQCWEFEADKRPTFKYCLEVLEKLHLQKLRSRTTGAHEGHYISTVHEYFQGISNEAYFLDERYTVANEEDTNKEKTPFLAPPLEGSIPKYLELLYDGDITPENDGYEIPNHILPSDFSKANKRKSSSFTSSRSDTNKNAQYTIDSAVVRNHGDILCGENGNIVSAQS